MKSNELKKYMTRVAKYYSKCTGIGPVTWYKMLSVLLWKVATLLEPMAPYYDQFLNTPIQDAVLILRNWSKQWKTNSVKFEAAMGFMSSEVIHEKTIEAKTLFYDIMTSIIEIGDRYENHGILIECGGPITPSQD